MADNIWDNSDGDNDANVDANWSLGHVPTGTDVAVFDSDTTSDDCSLSGNISCAGMRFDNAYSGTVDLVTHDLTLTGALTNIAGSTIDFGSGTHDLEDVTLDGTIDMASSTVTVSGNWNTAGVDTWDKGTSSVTLSGASKTLTANASTNGFYDLVISGSVTLSAPSNTTIYNSVDISGTYDLGVRSMNMSGATTLILSGTLTGSSFFYSSTQALPSTGTLDVKVYIRNATPEITARTYAKAVYVNKSASDTYVWEAGTHNYNGGLYNTNVSSGTYAFDFNTNDPTINVTGDVDFSDTSGTSSVDMGASTWTVSGNATFAGVDTLTPGTATFTMTGSGKTLTLGGNAIANLTINSAGTVSFVDAASISGTLDLDAGTLDMNGQIADLTNITSSGGIITFGSATHTISGDVDLSGLASYTATYLTFDGTGTQSIDLAAGTITTVEVTNASDVVTFTESFSTGSFLCTTADASMKVTSGKQIDVTNALRLYGTAGHEVGLTAVTPSSSFNLNATAAIREVGRVALTDINNNSGSNITVSFGINGGGNSNFDFIDAFVWDGGGVDNNFDTAENWIGDIAPTTGNAIYFDATSTKDCTWNDATSFTQVTVDSGYTGTITTSEHITLTIGIIVGDGTLTLGASKNINTVLFQLDAGATFNATSSNAITCTGNISVNSGSTVDLSGATFTASGTGVQGINLGTKTILALSVTNSTALVSVTESFTSTTFTTSGASVAVTAAKTITTTNISFTNTTFTSATPASAWLLVVSGPQTVTGVTVSDSDASGGNEIDASDGTNTDGGGNTKWDFGTTPVVVTVSENKNDKAGGAMALLLMR